MDEKLNQIKISTLNIPEGSEFTVNVYKMNIEYLFSSKPFSISDDYRQNSDIGQFSFVLPNFQSKIFFLSGEHRLGSDLILNLPGEFLNQNILVKVYHGTIERVISKFSSSLKVNFIDQYGILKVSTKISGQQVVPLAYVKVYARLNNSKVPTFYKDGYTDVRGEFDYCSLTTIRIKDVEQFSVFISHPNLGSHS